MALYFHRHLVYTFIKTSNEIKSSMRVKFEHLN